MSDGELATLMPSFELASLEKRYKGKYRQFVDEIELKGLEKVASLKTAKQPILYVANHQTCLDYFIPKYAIFFNGLPFPRTIAGSNLNNLFFRRLVHDLGAGGIIWHDRGNGSLSHKLKYLRAITETYKSGTPIMCFPEATRNRNRKVDPLNFNSTFYGAVLFIEELLEKEIVVSHIACDYDDIPEKGYYGKIDKTGRKSFSYYFWDILAYTRWKFKKNKGTVRINFGEPVLLDELAGMGDKKIRGERAASESRKIVAELFHEIRR